MKHLGDHRFRVDSVKTDPSGSSSHQSEEFDFVIFATPLSSSSTRDLRFDNFTKRDQLLNDIFDKYQMHQTVATFVKGTVLPKYRQLDILSCDISRDGSFFTSLGRLSSVDGEGKSSSHPPASSGGVYKVFSNHPLKPHDLYSLFDDIDETREVIWQAYPEYRQLKQPLPPFKLRSGAYYLNAIEWAASAIEMSLIGGKNVALLVCGELKLCQPDHRVDNSTVTNSKAKLEL